MLNERQFVSEVTWKTKYEAFGRKRLWRNEVQRGLAWITVDREFFAGKIFW